MLLILRNPRFRLLWSSSVVSEMGIMFHFTAHGWLTLTVTDSAFWVGAVSGVSGASIIVFSAISGVLADRLNRKYLIFMTLICQGSVAAVLATLIFTEQIHLWHILLASTIDGAMMSIRVPSRMALIMDIVGRRNIQNATAANLAAMTGTGIIIPPLAGRLIETHGIAWAYFSMSAAFLLSTVMLTFLSGVKSAERSGVASPIQDFKEGVKYVFTTPAVRMLVLLMLTSEIFGWAHEAMIPVMAREVLGTGPSGVGYLISAGSAGALLSAVILSAVGDIIKERRRPHRRIHRLRRISDSVRPVEIPIPVPCAHSRGMGERGYVRNHARHASANQRPQRHARPRAQLPDLHLGNQRLGRLPDRRDCRNSRRSLGHWHRRRRPSPQRLATNPRIRRKIPRRVGRIMLLILHNPRFRLLWSSSVVNFIGLIFYFTVHGWLALEVTDSEFWVGATYGMNGLSLVLFSAAAGVLVDRLNRKTLILIALSLSGEHCRGDSGAHIHRADTAVAHPCRLIHGRRCDVVQGAFTLGACAGCRGPPQPC